MGIIIDNSGSMRDKKARVAAAALALVRASNPQDEVFIVNFNDDAYLDQSFTSDIKKMEEALDRLETKGGTAMRDAVSMSIDYVKDKAKKDKKVLVIVTDGNDNTSNINLEELVRKSQQSDVLIYSIGILSEETPSDARKAKRALKELATASGGMDYYPKDLEEIVRRSAKILNVPIDEPAAVEIARRARGTPRIVNRLLRRVRDYAQVRAAGTITLEVAHAGLKLLQVDENGFDEVDRKLLRTIIDKFGGGPVGLNTIAAAISEEKDAIEDIYEPFLIQAGFLDRTPRGRVATSLAYRYFGLPMPAEQRRDSRLW